MQSFPMTVSFKPAAFIADTHAEQSSDARIRILGINAGTLLASFDREIARSIRIPAPSRRVARHAMH